MGEDAPLRSQTRIAMHRHLLETRHQRKHWSLAAAAAAVLLAACGSGGGSSAGAGSAQPSAVRLALTDAPGCGFDHLNVTVEKVRIHQSSTAQDADAGWTEIPLVPARRIDLLTLTNGALHELGTTALPAGHYAQMRLVLSDAAGQSTLQQTGGAELPLALTGGSSVRVPGSFDVVAGQTADLVFDFDACRSVTQAGDTGAYQLKPIIAVFPRVHTAIEGTLAAALPPGTTTVSAQQGGTTVRSTRPDAAGKFSIPYLQQGTYTVVIHSDGHATGVITGVPVSDGTTTVSTAAAAISLPSSTMAGLSGSAAEADDTGSGSPTTAALVDGEVRASQSLTGGDSIEVRSAQLDSTLGTYRLSVPKAAPVKAAFAVAGPLSFAPDPLGAGAYSIDLLLRDPDAGE
jgi:hypothetical protein